MKTEKSQDKFDVTVAKDLADRPRPELVFHIDEILPKGLYILAGDPKAGKSFLVLHMCGAIASGEDFWGYAATKCRVLYLALEDTPDSISRRIHDLNLRQYDLTMLDLVFESKGMYGGFEEQIANYMSDHSDTKLVVIDTFADIRDTDTAIDSKSPYLTDKRVMRKLRAIAHRHDISIILVHHSNKAEHLNVIKKISGTNGLMGGSDGNWILERPKPEETKGKITMNNRHSKTFCFDIEFCEETLRWNNCGKHIESSDTEEELITSIDSWLDDSWEGTAAELVSELKNADVSFNMNSSVVSRTLKRVAFKLKSYEKIEYTPSRKSNKKIIELKRIS